MNCPICTNFVRLTTHDDTGAISCKHPLGKWIVSYVRPIYYSDGRTIVYLPYEVPSLVLGGFCLISQERIERLLLLK
jgi:hypothetical protein